VTGLQLSEAKDSLANETSRLQARQLHMSANGIGSDFREYKQNEHLNGCPLIDVSVAGLLNPVFSGPANLFSCPLEAVD